MESLILKRGYFMYNNNYILTSEGRMITVSDEELYHYGVKGMKWGHRKALPESSIARNVRETKAAAKSANKAYRKSFSKAYDNSWKQFTKKQRAANDARWDDAANKAEISNKADKAYKAAKKARKDAVKSTYKDLNKKATLGEKLTYNNATRKQAAKYIVDNNMSVADATKKAKGDAWRNTAIYVGAYAAVTVATLYKNR
jgi:hypothetical protein